MNVIAAEKEVISINLSHGPSAALINGQKVVIWYKRNRANRGIEQTA